MQITKIMDKDKKNILSFKPEPYYIINLPIPDEIKEPSLFDCMNLYCKGELLENENSWFDEKNNRKVDVIKETKFFALSSVSFSPINSSNVYINIFLTYNSKSTR